MEKKMYYTVDNGDTTVTVDFKGLADMIEAEASCYTENKNKEEEPYWGISLIWMTEDEFDNLPEAY